MKIPAQFFRFSLISLLLGLGLLGVGCSSPQTKYPYNTVRLTEIRQSPSGQLALIYNIAPERTPGQRVFLPDVAILTHCVSTALAEIKANPGYGETFSGGLVLHRKFSETQRGAEDYWIELDPFALTGTWLPPLDQPALSVGAALSALPLSFNATKNLALPDEKFLWQTGAGPFDTTVTGHPLFQPNRRDTFTGKTEAVFGATAEIIGGIFAFCGLVVGEAVAHGAHIHASF